VSRQMSLLTGAKTELYRHDWKDVDIQGSLMAGASSGGQLVQTALSIASCLTNKATSTKSLILQSSMRLSTVSRSWTATFTFAKGSMHLKPQDTFPRISNHLINRPFLPKFTTPCFNPTTFSMLWGPSRKLPRQSSQTQLLSLIVVVEPVRSTLLCT
jgi:hypothetical protein